MHSLLETYLSDVSAYLSALPTKQRAEELREMRTHLENAVIVNRELGQSEEEAAQNAIAQFGTPQDLGENVVRAWRRGERRQNRRSFWGATAAATLVLCVMTFLMNQIWYYGILELLLPRTFLLDCGKHQAWGTALTQAMFLANFGLAGLVSGSLFPKQAMRGVCLGLVVFWVGWAAVDGLGGYLIGEDRLGWVLSAIISAWVGRRWRLTRSRRRLAAG